MASIAGNVCAAELLVLGLMIGQREGSRRPANLGSCFLGMVSALQQLDPIPIIWPIAVSPSLLQRKQGSENNHHNSFSTKQLDRKRIFLNSQGIYKPAASLNTRDPRGPSWSILSQIPVPQCPHSGLLWALGPAVVQPLPCMSCLCPTSDVVPISKLISRRSSADRFGVRRTAVCCFP